MENSKLIKTGAQVLIDCLAANGTDCIYGVPGESYLSVLDALYQHPTLTFFQCRQEGGAAMMADADGKLTGRPGICFVTRGPGATNASAGVHIAFQDSTPMILFIGQVARDQRDREAFQEIDYRRMFGEMTKWVAEIDDAKRIPEYVQQAFSRSMCGRPGPVVLALPEDMLRDLVDVPVPGPAAAIHAHAGTDDMKRFAALFQSAKKPLLMLGGRGWTKQACLNVQDFAETTNIPITVSFRNQDLFNNNHDLYAGDVGIGINPKLAERVRTCDLLIAFGPRLGEMTTGGYQLFDIPEPRQSLIHIHSGAEELGRVYRPELAINASPPGFAKALKNLDLSAGDWAEWTARARSDYLSWTTPTLISGDVQLGEIVRSLSDTLNADTIICNGAGNYSGWVHRYGRYRSYPSQLAPTSGSMGYGVPAAIAAKRRYPDRDVIAFAGDGCFMMHGQELATAVQHKIPVIIIIINNSMFGTIRMHQERNYPKRISGTELHNPDFTALAHAYGAFGETVTNTADFMPAFERARAANRPAVIEIQCDGEAISTTATISSLRGDHV